MLIDLAEQWPGWRIALRRAADAVFYLPYGITSARELVQGPNKVSGIGPKIAKKTNVDGPPCGFPARESTTAKMFASVRCAAVVFNLCVQHVLSST